MSGKRSKTPSGGAAQQVSGDVFALDGQWQAAVSGWAADLDGPNSAQAESRLRWFLEMTGGGVDPRQDPWRPLLPEPFLTGVAAATIGTAAVLIAESLVSPWNHALAVVAWLLYVLAAVCGLVYAKRHGVQHPIPLTAELLDIAHQQAKRIDTGSATIDHKYTG